VSASDHVSPYIKAYHISWDETPPHELPPDILQDRPEGNVHPDIMHMGTRRAAMQIHRTHLHEYEIDPSKMEPVVYSDEKITVDATKSPYNYKGVMFRRGMRGKQEGLWETIVPNPQEVASRGVVTPYRNRIEDPGSISYMVPKSAIKGGAVRYKGVTDLTKRTPANRTKRDEIEEEEKMYRYSQEEPWDYDEFKV